MNTTASITPQSLQLPATLEDESGCLHISALADGGYLLRGEGREPSTLVPHSPCTTRYPLSLITLLFRAYKSIHTCDEISRDTDQSEAELDVRYSVLAYLPEQVTLRPMQILDYGCGAGSSSLALSRMFAHSRITGVDFMADFLEIARQRALHYGADNLRFEQVPASGSIASMAGSFDMVFLNAVYEHLLPLERRPVLAEAWRVLKPGGTLVLNQTPHRWFPIETHTSGLPAINYLPDSQAKRAIDRFSRRDIRNRSWEQLLRAGVRGGSVGEILRNLRQVDPGAQLLRPIRFGRSWAAIWYAAKRQRIAKIRSPLTRTAIAAMQAVVGATGLPIAPYLNLAFRKP